MNLICLGVTHNQAKPHCISSSLNISRWCCFAIEALTYILHIDHAAYAGQGNVCRMRKTQLCISSFALYNWFVVHVMLRRPDSIELIIEHQFLSCDIYFFFHINLSWIRALSYAQYKKLFMCMRNANTTCAKLI